MGGPVRAVTIHSHSHTHTFSLYTTHTLSDTNLTLSATCIKTGYFYVSLCQAVVQHQVVATLRRDNKPCLKRKDPFYISATATRCTYTFKNGQDTQGLDCFL